MWAVWCVATPRRGSSLPARDEQQVGQPSRKGFVPLLGGTPTLSESYTLKSFDCERMQDLEKSGGKENFVVNCASQE
eukprot:3666123-Pyramimonas_sp.AAC.3